MAKTPSDKLYKMIHALSPSERRYFHIYLKGKSVNTTNYLELYEAMESSTAYDDDALRKMLYPNDAAGSKKFSVLKAYLYELLLKCLQLFDEEQSVEYKLNHYLMSVSVLYRRGYYDECEDLLNKATYLAKKFEAFAHQLDIIQWQKHIAYTRIDVDYLNRELPRLDYEESILLEKINDVLQYRKAFYNMLIHVKKEASGRSLPTEKPFQNILAMADFEDAQSARSYKAKVMYYRTLSLYYYANREYEAFYDTGKQLLTLMEAHKHFLLESLTDYIAALSNYILSCGLLAHYEEVRVGLEKLRNLYPNTLDDSIKIVRQYYTNHFALCIFTGEFEEGRAAMEMHFRKVANFDASDYETSSFYFQYFMLCFGSCDYEMALEYLNKWLSQKRTVDREDLQSLARILQLITHWELGNNLLLTSVIRGAERYIRKRNRLYELEKKVIHCFQQLLRLQPKQSETAYWEELKQVLERLSGESQVQSFFQTFDLISYTDSKIKQIPFATVVQAKYQSLTKT